ncbi:glycosyltransferase family 2 protein [Desulfatiglans anilini]|uniref:glycosyltransferase family 2 protein n=1 Tax=Desulfatiglans anilini TaxID=90728 RepID=UPI00040F32E7|nr:glycosyltransferase family 2 protein [Desulfatiglans anilini]
MATRGLHQENEKPAPFISIIIVTWNKKKDVLNLLEALSKLDYPVDRLETVLVDNASTDGTTEQVHLKYPAVHILKHPENLGGSGGFNAGMRWILANRPNSDYLWLLDNDVLVPPESLDMLVRALESRPDAAVCGSKILDQQNPEELIEVGAYIDYRRGDIRQNRGTTHQQPGTDGIEEVDYVAACSLLVRASVLKSVGLWHEDFFIYWDDMEWGVRFKTFGYRVLATHHSIVYHPSWAGRTSDKSVVWRNYYRARNGLCFFNHYSSGLKRRLILGRMILRFHLIGANNCLRSETAVSDAFSEAIDDFFRGRYGKKSLSLPESNLERFIKIRRPEDIFVFLPRETMVQMAEPILAQLLLYEGAFRLHLIVSNTEWKDRPSLFHRNNLLTFKPNASGGITMIDKMRLLLSIRSKMNRNPLLITPPLTPRFLAMTGLPIAKVDFEKGETITIQQLNVPLLLRSSCKTVWDVFRALLAPPKRIWRISEAIDPDPS